ncbi:MAG: hypothetical protein HQK64_06815, partial [Desulfamplus sp.]|nr:hypothetical protein [Desulfamplus sp.]
MFSIFVVEILILVRNTAPIRAGLLSSNKILTKYVSFHKAIQSISEYAGYKAEKIWRLFNMNL